MPHELYPYQREAVAKTLSLIERGFHTGIVSMATGLGKTITAFELYEQLATDRFDRCLFIAPSRSLIFQTAEEFRQQKPLLSKTVPFGLHGSAPGLGIVMGNVDQSNAKFLVCSSQTIVDENPSDVDDIKPSDMDYDKKTNSVVKSRHSRRNVLVSRRVDRILAHGVPRIVIYDECHHAASDGSIVLIRRLQQVRQALKLSPLIVVGFTATPVRDDGRGLDNIFSTIYDRKDFQYGQKHGYLAPFETPVRVVLKTPVSDSTIHEAYFYEDQIYQTWLDLASNRSTVCFTGPVGDKGAVEVAKSLVKYFQSKGVRAAHVDSNSCTLPDGSVGSLKDRSIIFRGVQGGEIPILFMYSVGLEGLNIPRLDCLFWLRQTDNVVLRTQALGRILRRNNDPNKKALVVDFTSQPFEIDTIGSLVGYKVNPLTARYEPEITEEDDLILESPKLQKDQHMVFAREYRVAKIIDKQSKDWYEIPLMPGHLVMTISPVDTLIVVPPNVEYAAEVQTALRDMTMARSLEQNPYAEGGHNESYRLRYENYLRLDDDMLNQYLEFLMWSDVLYNNYTVWHSRLYKSGRGGREFASLHQSGFVVHSPDLSVCLSNATMYIYEKIVNSDPESGSDQSSLVSLFSLKKKAWKKYEPTESQIKKLRQLGVDVVPSTRGEASNLIAFHVCFPPVHRILRRAEEIMRSICQ